MEISDFRQSLRRTVSIPVFLLILLAVILTSQVWYVVSSLRQVDRTDLVISQVRLLMRYVLDMETGLRGYLLTGERRFLEPYELADGVIPRTFDDLQTLVADDPVSKQQVQELRGDFNSWREYSQHMIDMRAQRGNATDVELNLAGKQMMDALRERREKFVVREEVKRDLQSKVAWRATKIVLPALALLTIAVGLAIGTLTRRRMLSLSDTYERHLRSERERGDELRRSREWLFTILRSLGEGVIATDAEGKVEFMNPVAERLTGWPARDAKAHALDEVFVSFNERTHEVVAANDFLVAAREGVFTNHTILRSRDNTEIHIDRTAAPIRDDSGHVHGSVVVFRDQTDRQRAEDALRSSERLALMGRLSATIAHEIRNPLDSVTNLVYLVRRSAALPQEASQKLTLAEEELDRMAQITRQLLGFNREAKQTIDVDVAELMDSAITLFGPKLSMAGITVQREYLAHPLIKGFPGELRQVLSNLIANSMDASPRGARIVVRIAHACDWRDSARPGVRIVVSDCGSGIPEEARAGLFQPFYTTKGERGTGLGLWVSRGIIEKHEGYIHFRTSTDPSRSGTSFRIFLPQTPRFLQTA